MPGLGPLIVVSKCLGGSGVLRDDMKTRTVQVSEGENLGPIDWSYDFASHNWNRPGGGTNPECVAQAIESLRKIETWLVEGKAVEIYLYSMWAKVLDIGMYDGWPYWRPVPSVCTETWLGGEWHCFTACWAGVRAV